MSSIARAQRDLHEIIEGPVLDFEITYDALIQACQINFIELQVSSDNTILQEVKEMITRIEELTSENGAYGRMIDILFLKAKMAILDLRYNDAEKILVQAEFLIDELELPHYEQLLGQVRDGLEHDILRIKSILEQNQSLMERAKLMELNDYLQEAHLIRGEISENVGDTDDIDN